MLEAIRRLLAAHPELRSLRVEGHTDARGAASVNLELSQRRAESVYRWLLQAGIEEERLQWAGYGERRPLAEGDDEWTQSRNRRVEIVILERGP